jgi:hypothetical protein
MRSSSFPRLAISTRFRRETEAKVDDGDFTPLFCHACRKLSGATWNKLPNRIRARYRFAARRCLDGAQIAKDRINHRVTVSEEKEARKELLLSLSE